MQTTTAVKDVTGMPQDTTANRTDCTIITESASIYR